MISTEREADQSPKPPQHHLLLTHEAPVWAVAQPRIPDDPIAGFNFAPWRALKSAGEVNSFSKAYGLDLDECRLSGHEDDPEIILHFSTKERHAVYTTVVGGLLHVAEGTAFWGDDPDAPAHSDETIFVLGMPRGFPEFLLRTFEASASAADAENFAEGQTAKGGDADAARS